MFLKKIKILSLLISTLSLYTLNAQQIQDPKIVIQQFFKAMNTQDSVLLKSTLHKSATLETIKKSDYKIEIQQTELSKFISAIGNKNLNYTFEERILNYDSIFNDGILATAWLPYELYVNKAISHCGVNTINLVYEENTWKIIRILDTRKKTNCK
jgi:hypothetical protein